MFAPRVVPNAELPPAQCVLTGLMTGPFVDTGVDIQPVNFGTPHVYIQRDICRELGKVVGMVDVTEVARLHEHNQALVEQLEEARQELAAMNKEFEAIDLLTSKGFRSRKKPGRPPAEKTAA